MVAHIVRLKLTLLRNGLRRSAWQVVGLVVSALYAAGLTALALIGMAALSTQDTDFARTVLVLAGTVLVLGWWLVPLVAFGVDATLDPERFRTFAVPRRQLLTGLALAGVVGVPGLTTVLVTLGSALAWWRYPAAALAALVGAVLGVAVCVVGSRAVTTLLAPLVNGRRYREVAAVVLIVPLFLLGPLITAVSRGIEVNQDTFPATARVLGWTPFGAPWALAADVAEGSWAGAVGKLAVAVVSVLVLLAVWDRSLAAALVRAPDGGGHGSARARGLGLFGHLPATPLGAIVARCLTYWVRDPRYASAVAVVPLLPILLWFLGREGGGGLLLAGGPGTGFMMGWAISADIAYDSTAFWTHVAAPLRGRVDRLGRVCAGAALGVPTTVALTLVSLALAGRWDATAPMLGLSLGVLATALGVASVVAARVVYPVPKPGDNPFSSRQGASTASLVSQLVGMALLAALASPTVALAVAALVTGSALLGVGALVVGLVLGVVVLAVGVRMGGDLYDRRAPELLQSIVSFS